MTGRQQYMKEVYECENIYWEIGSVFREMSSSPIFDYDISSHEIEIKIFPMDREMIEKHLRERLRREDGQFIYHGEFYDYNQMFSLIKDKCFVINVIVDRQDNLSSTRPTNVMKEVRDDSADNLNTKFICGGCYNDCYEDDIYCSKCGVKFNNTLYMPDERCKFCSSTPTGFRANCKLDSCKFYKRKELVEIIRCKDCKFSKFYEDGMTQISCKYSSFGNGVEGYCNYAEPREE